MTIQQFYTIIDTDKNPYSVTNMRKAFANLLIADVQLIKNNEIKFTKGKLMFTEGNQALSINKQLSTEQGNAVANNGINATHYYIKFIPRNDADYSLLKRDSNLVIYPFPLDNEISPYNGNYRDSAVADGVPTYQYAAVPISYVLPAVPYQKIEDLYLPDEQSKNSQVTVKGEGGSSFTVSVQQLVNQALCDGDDPNNPPTESKAATNNNILQAKVGKPSVISLLPPEDEEPCDGTSSGGGPYPPDDEYRNGENWRPHGRITVYDDVLGKTIGVEGIRVKVYRWFTTYTGITDAEGYYAVDGWYTRSANYWFQFERYDFSVNDHHGGPQEVSGPNHTEDAWNKDLKEYNKFCATIFRAAYHYYYKDIQGLRRPPQNSFWATQVKLAAFDWEQTSDNGDMWEARNGLLGSLIHIYRPQRTTEEIYATTMHELAHAVHWDMSSPVGSFTSYSLTNDRVYDSWSTGIQWILTRMTYPYYKGRENSSSRYTNLIMDLIDGPTGENYNFGTSYPIDQVHGYNIVDIQNALKDATTLNQWKTNLKNNYGNTTENYVDALFDYWAVN